MGPDIPTPRVPIQSTRAKRASDTNHSAMKGLLDHGFEMAGPIEHYDDVVGPAAEDLIGDVRVARADVLRLRERHGCG